MNIIKALLGKMDVLELKFRKKNEKANDSILSALMENPEGYKLEAYIGRDEQNHQQNDIKHKQRKAIIQNALDEDHCTNT